MLRQDVIATSTSRAVDGFSMLETCSSTSGASNPESLRVARWCELGFLSRGVLSEVTSKPCPCGVTGSTLCMTAMPFRFAMILLENCGGWCLMALSESGEQTTLMDGLFSSKPSLR
jgi:hypothetical protein